MIVYPSGSFLLLPVLHDDHALRQVLDGGLDGLLAVVGHGQQQVEPDWREAGQPLGLGQALGLEANVDPRVGAYGADVGAPVRLHRQHRADQARGS